MSCGRDFYVIRRVGGLEVRGKEKGVLPVVIRRVGGLEDLDLLL